MRKAKSQLSTMLFIVLIFVAAVPVLGDQVNTVLVHFDNSASFSQCNIQKDWSETTEFKPRDLIHFLSCNPIRAWKKYLCELKKPTRLSTQNIINRALYEIIKSNTVLSTLEFLRMCENDLSTTKCMDATHRIDYWIKRARNITNLEEYDYYCSGNFTDEKISKMKSTISSKLINERPLNDVEYQGDEEDIESIVVWKPQKDATFSRRSKAFNQVSGYNKVMPKKLIPDCRDPTDMVRFTPIIPPYCEPIPVKVKNTVKVQMSMWTADVIKRPFPVCYCTQWTIYRRCYKAFFGSVDKTGWIDKSSPDKDEAVKQCTIMYKEKRTYNEKYDKFDYAYECWWLSTTTKTYKKTFCKKMTILIDVNAKKMYSPLFKDGEDDLLDRYGLYSNIYIGNTYHLYSLDLKRETCKYNKVLTADCMINFETLQSKSVHITCPKKKIAEVIGGTNLITGRCDKTTFILTKQGHLVSFGNLKKSRKKLPPWLMVTGDSKRINVVLKEHPGLSLSRHLTESIDTFILNRAQEANIHLQNSMTAALCHLNMKTIYLAEALMKLVPRTAIRLLRDDNAYSAIIKDGIVYTYKCNEVVVSGIHLHPNDYRLDVPHDKGCFKNEPLELVDCDSDERSRNLFIRDDDTFIQYNIVKNMSYKSIRSDYGTMRYYNYTSIDYLNFQNLSTFGAAFDQEASLMQMLGDMLVSHGNVTSKLSNKALITDTKSELSKMSKFFKSIGDFFDGIFGNAYIVLGMVVGIPSMILSLYLMVKCCKKIREKRSTAPRQRPRRNKRDDINYYQMRSIQSDPPATRETEVSFG